MKIQQKEGPANIDAIIQSKYPTWEYQALESKKTKANGKRTRLY